MDHYDLVVTCATGLEKLVEEEIRSFGGTSITSSNGVVNWKGNKEAAYRSCLWSRYGSRIFLKIKSFQVTTEQDLYDQVLDVCWDELFDLQTTFAVSCTISAHTQIKNNRFTALKVKDGIADFFRNSHGERPSVQGNRPGFPLHVHIDKTHATLFLDMSGESLHRRGYRASGTLAPLKENLAAAIVGLSAWQTSYGDLVDPMCGSGTLLIEAALMFGDSAPGLSRSYFGFGGWLSHENDLWQRLVDEALEREKTALEKKWPKLIGYDADPVAVSAARKNIIQAGLEEQVQVKQGELANLAPPSGKGMVLSNLPYGERLSEKTIITYLYRAFGRQLSERFSGWKAGVFISNPELVDSFGLQWDRKHKLFNGPISCRLLTGLVPDKDIPNFVWQLPEAGETGELGNRLKKNLKKMMKWAAKEEVYCYRIYDRDLPEYNLSIDLYSKWVHVQEYAPPKSINQELASTRLRDALETIRKVFGIRSNRIFVKKRERQKGAKQYQKKNSKKKMYEVREGHCFYLVNFTDYLDTGLFLDHRPVRRQIFTEARNKRFLNLYGYTGTASVQAARGGADSTTTVDLSANYLEWTRMNLAVNGFSEFRNRVIKADCLEWLKEDTTSYDLIFIDPPTFSNTKKKGRVFDIQRDHVQLLRLALARLSETGKIIFSTNFRKFQLDDSLSKLCSIENITAKTIPMDFSRNAKIHSCWEISKQD